MLLSTTSATFEKRKVMTVINNLSPELQQLHEQTLEIIQRGIIALMQGEHLKYDELAGLTDQVRKRFTVGYAESDQLQEIVQHQGDVTMSLAVHPYHGRFPNYRNNVICTVSSEHHGDSVRLRLHPSSD